jgi:hypothetical protein
VSDHRPDEHGDEPSDEHGDERAAREAELERRRRRARVFGEVLPEQTLDDASEDEGAATSDDWLRRQKPPHHD